MTAKKRYIVSVLKENIEQKIQFANKDGLLNWENLKCNGNLSK